MFRAFIFVALVSLSYGQRPSFLPTAIINCVADGNHCIANADCCSTNCSTSRCATSSTSNAVRPSSTVEFSDRFNNCQSNGNNCNVGRDCCSGECASFKCIAIRMSTMPAGKPQIDNRNDAPQRICQAVNQRCSSQQDCCNFLVCEQNVCKDKSVYVMGTESLGYSPSQYFNNRFGEEDNQTSTIRPSQGCADIGQKCYKAGECCSPLKCHSFLHQCVT